MCYIEFVAVCRILMISFGSSFNKQQQAPTSELLESMSTAGSLVVSKAAAVNIDLPHIWY